MKYERVGDALKFTCHSFTISIIGDREKIDFTGTIPACHVAETIEFAYKELKRLRTLRETGENNGANT